ncbi:U32 family peptidase [Oceanicella actignis]|uniref:Peptidase family U32 n=2 Tax=Oceanicella actignis TaxID=1189325 RepID=A0A1M7RX17_9RHOB|nr:Peptidase family U32 [Oceanicella actignis]SHN50887.1 Peptidase family U32 [Oceanicella actignis]
MPLRTTDDRPILRVNGIQTQSESYLALIDEIPELVAAGVTHLRLMPQAVDMAAAANLFRALLDARLSAAEAEARLREICGDAPLSNGFYHGKAGYRRIARAPAA